MCQVKLDGRSKLAHTVFLVYGRQQMLACLQAFTPKMCKTVGCSPAITSKQEQHLGKGMPLFGTCKKIMLTVICI